jgi:hypothetical protein
MVEQDQQTILQVLVLLTLVVAVVEFALEHKVQVDLVVEVMVVNVDLVLQQLEQQTLVVEVVEALQVVELVDQELL